MTKRSMLCILFTMPFILYGQSKPDVAPPSKSDTFSEDQNGRKVRVQHRSVSMTNFRIAGVDLAHGQPLEDAARVLGKVAAVASGDASTADRNTCYRSAQSDNNTRLIFGEGEVDHYFTLSSDDSALKKRPCLRSIKITRDLTTSSGLHLGQTQEEVIAILGLPTSRSRVHHGKEFLTYQLESRQKTPPAEFTRALEYAFKREPEADRKILARDLEYFDREESIRAKFLNGALIELSVDLSETN